MQGSLLARICENRAELMGRSSWTGGRIGLLRVRIARHVLPLMGTSWLVKFTRFSKEESD